ncbi:DotD/TraH family lipoprotein [Psychrobacter sp. AOP31-A1-22]|uniref:DotD/TraH family lipoprotein n=1 Tax=Psychrobacter sp. AOP31-A1-22 TaxID=3457696 RepID=UPI0040351D4E
MKSSEFPLNKKVLGAITLMGMMAVTTGCSSGYKSKNVSGALPNTPNSLEIISQESQKALNAQKMLVAYREQYNNTLDYRRKSFTEDKVKVDYIGKPQPLLNSLAIRYGYRFLEYGVERDLPTVNFTDYWSTPENIVVNLSAQLGDQAGISVDKQQKVITLVYP